MIFPSYIFILVFLPAVLIAWYAIKPLRVRLALLTLASYVFYGWWDYRFLSLMIASTLLDYACGRMIHRNDDPRVRKRWLFLSIAGNLSILGIFKYYNFFATSLSATLATIGIEASWPTLHLILPLGISFYTFQSMSYTIDIYRGKCKPTSDPLIFSAYVSMFPQLVAGPIVRYEHMEKQLLDLPNAKPNTDMIADGVHLFMIGMIKKIWIADSLAPVAALAFDSGNSPQLFTAWAGALCYTFQLYFDFSGYSDMARGLGFMLGFHFPLNFNSPYKSASPSEFWNRWHITLSNWLRDYLYIPLGGSRHGVVKTLRNLGLTMFLGGLWHGAAWTFVLWGLYHGFFLALHAVWKRIGRVTIPRVPAVVMTFCMAMVGWTIFRANSFENLTGVLSGLVGANGIEPLTYFSVTLGLHLPAIYEQFYGLHGLAFLSLVAMIAFFAPNSEQLPKPKHPLVAGALAILLLVTLTTFIEETPFLYFTF